MASAFQSAMSVILEDYKDELRRQINATYWWMNDGVHGPPDPRPFLGPPEPVDTVCGDIACRCCAHWRDQWEEHYCD